jgi:LPXTG-motif cell wall-anchored protein
MRTRHLAATAVLGIVVTMLAPSLWHGAAAAEACPPGRPPGTPGAGAQPGARTPGYPLGQCELALSQSAGTAGARVRASGAGFAPGSNVALAIAGASLGSVAVDNTGAFSTTFTVPRTVSTGAQSVTATGVAGAGESRQLSALFNVIGGATSRGASRSASGKPLAKTGTSATVPLTIVGAGLALAGTVAVVSARRRRARA